MLVLDTNHLTELQWETRLADQLITRLETSGQAVTTTIINAQETLEGWLAKINKHNKAAREQVPYYARLGTVLTFYARWNLLPFDAAAAAKFEELRSLKLRGPGMRDLRIAAIVLNYNATLLSADLKDFRPIPNLQVEDWIHGAE